MLEQVKIDELCELVEYLVGHGFTDMVDASAEISFLEYGMLRNPKTNLVIYCMPIDSDCEEIMLDWSLVGIDDVKECLEDVGDGFFSFIGSSHEEVLNKLDNDYLSGIIQDANMWDGTFNQSCMWNHDVDSIKRIIEED